MDAEAAGVMFTANPFSGACDEIVVTANWGIGESVVADLVSPDTFIISKGSPQRVISSQVGNKQRMVRLRRDESSLIVASAEVVPVPASMRNEACLNEMDLIQLGKLAHSVEQHYGSPQDIEWAKCGGNNECHR